MGGPAGRFTAAIGAAAVALACCAAGGCTRAPEAPHLYAAASLMPAVRALPAAGAPDFTAVHGSTSLLAQQIRGGGAPGVFLGADVRWADALEADGQVAPRTRLDLLGVGLAVIVPADSRRALRSLADLTASDVRRIALAETGYVTAGRYARAALTAAGVWDEVRLRVVETTDARAVVAIVARGEVDAGIAYATDARASGVRLAFDVPADLHPPIVYPLLLVRGAPPAARELWTWLQGDAAGAAFERAGFRRLARSR